MTEKKEKIVVFVQGGVVTNIFSSIELEVNMIDYDNISADEKPVPEFEIDSSIRDLIPVY